MRQKTELRAYQDRIATFLYEHDESLCVVRPGGGKTAAALTAITELMLDSVARHALVIAPKRVATEVWPAEIALWEHTWKLNFSLVTGNPRQREKKLNGFHRHITIVGLDNVGWLIEQLDGWPADNPMFDLLVIDECSKLRDPTGVRAKLLAKHAHRWKMVWGLSGTLRPSGPLDLFMPSRVVTRGKLWGKSFYKWQQEHFYTTDFNGYDWKPLPGHEEVLNDQIAQHCVTLQEDEYPQLPALSVVLDRVTLPREAREQYATMHKRLIAKVRPGRGNDVAPALVVAANKAVATGKLAQIANGFVYRDDTPEGATPVPDNIQTHMIHDEKRAWLADTVEQATGPMLLIYEFREDLLMIRDVCGGGVPWLGAGVTDRQATENINNWNAGKLPFFAIHPRSGGHGLNLQQGGCDMAWIAPTWSPELWEQTIARLHRPGQTKPVMVRVCVANHTVDDMKLDRVHYKMSEQAAFEKYLREMNR